MDHIGLILTWLEKHFDHEMAIAEIGMWIVGFYLIIFLILAVVRGKFKLVRNGNLIRVGPMLKAWLKVPAIFMALGLFGMLVYATCAENYPNHLYDGCGPREEFCLECPKGIVVTTKQVYGYDYDVHWIATLANAYGMGVIKVQMFVVPVAGAIAMVAILYAIWRFILFPFFRLIGVVIGFGWQRLRKIPIRL